MPLIVGVGARSTVHADNLDTLIGATLAAYGLDPARVTALATVDRRATGPALVEVAARRGWPLLGYPAEELAGEPVPHPSPLVRSVVGTPSVAEAAALHAVRDTGAEPVLLVGKHTDGTATVAVAAPAGETDTYRHQDAGADRRGEPQHDADRRGDRRRGADQHSTTRHGTDQHSEETV
ncbi:cobalamin biosynthesis protein [Micromonospora sp. NBC_01699]|uniref:cobalamin biosynthesis protein n=1 Tax=Micromonospora sp. NBC_01699 TaxID=2975984 RepID=UPI002E334E67|nr:cobalamin biosynthesis protein [Micromonospora sp. NBC_01699]